MASDPQYTLNTPCYGKSCAEIAGPQPQPDLEIYNLQTNIRFANIPLIFVVTCPVGVVCPPGLPVTVNYPPTDFPFIFPPPSAGGGPILLQLKGCKSTVTRVLPAQATAAQIQQAINEIVSEVAYQQALCDYIPEYPPAYVPALSISEIDEDFACLQTEYVGIISTSSLQLPISASVSGTLPPGTALTIDESNVVISGTPTTAGDYSFTVTVENPYNQSATRTFNVSVAGITTASPLTSATIDTPYSETLAQSGFSGTLTWGIASGSLPDGLSIDSATGEISGTPTTLGVASFTVFCTNGTEQCLKTFGVEVIDSGSCAVDFSAASWVTSQVDLPVDCPGTTGTIAGSAVGNTVSIAAVGGSICDCSPYFSATGSLAYTGAETECSLVIAGTGIGTNTTFIIQITQDGNPVLSLYDQPPGSYPFTISAGAASAIEISVYGQASSGGDCGFGIIAPGDLNVSVVFGS